jgi:hypothetical protein
VRLFRQTGIVREGQVVAVVRRPVRQVPRSQDGRRRRVGNSLIPFRKLEDDRLGRHAGKRVFPQVGRIGHRVARLRDPFSVLDHFLDSHGAGHVVDHWGLDITAGSNQAYLERDAVP